MSGWRPLIERAFELVELAGAYIEDGALHTGAAKLRDAADKMQQAADLRDAAMRDGQ